MQVPLSKLIAEGGADNDEFGYSVAVYSDEEDGDTVVVGAHQHDVNGNVNAGAAYVFTRGSSGWVQRARLSAEDGTNNDEFGISVAVDGDTVVVGAYGDGGGRRHRRGRATGVQLTYSPRPAALGSPPPLRPSSPHPTARLTTSSGFP